MIEPRYEEVLLFSGGPDSLIAWHYLKQPNCLYYDFGQRYAKQEIVATRRLMDALRGLDVTFNGHLTLSSYEEENTTTIPLRDLFLVSLASYMASRVWIVVQQGEMSGTGAPEFFDRVSALLSALHGRRVIVSTPFAEMTKSQMIDWYLKAGHSPIHLGLTVSCYNPKGTRTGHCGNCSACFYRWVAFTNNALPMEMDRNMKNFTELPKYMEQLKAGYYDEEWGGEMIKALKRIGVWE